MSRTASSSVDVFLLAAGDYIRLVCLWFWPASTLTSQWALQGSQGRGQTGVSRIGPAASPTCCLTAAALAGQEGYALSSLWNTISSIGISPFSLVLPLLPSLPPPLPSLPPFSPSPPPPSPPRPSVFSSACALYQALDPLSACLILFDTELLAAVVPSLDSSLLLLAQQVASFPRCFGLVCTN